MELSHADITANQRIELVNLYHLAHRNPLAVPLRVPVGDRRYDRMLWAAKQWAKQNPRFTSSQAYKALSNRLEQ